MFSFLQLDRITIIFLKDTIGLHIELEIDLNVSNIKKIKSRF